MIFIDNIFPEKERAKLSIGVSRRICYLFWLDILLLVYFCPSSIILYTMDPPAYKAFFIAVMLTESVFITSIVLIAKKKYWLASYVGAAGVLLNACWVGMLIPITSPQGFYRFGVYLLATIVTNSMMALSKRQVKFSLALSSLIFLIFTLFKASPSLGGIHGETIGIVVLLVTLIVSVEILLLIVSNLNDDLVAIAADESRLNGERACALSSLVNESRGALEEAEELRSASEQSIKRSAEIKKALQGLKDESRALSRNAAGADESTQNVVRKARSLRDEVRREIALLEQTLDAVAKITGISAELASLACNKKEAIVMVMKSAEEQARAIRSLKSISKKVDASTGEVGAAAGGISDLSEKTGLLAMNASIEAAHAGVYGKGFAVISQEVRKLSEETKNQTARIARALESCSCAASESADATGRLEAISSTLHTNIEGTFEALNSILRGLDSVSAAASQLNSRASELVELAKHAGSDVDAQTSDIEEGAANIEEIGSFAARLATKVALILNDFSSIENAVEKARLIGDKSAAHMEQLDGRLAMIEGSSSS